MGDVTHYIGRCKGKFAPIANCPREPNASLPKRLTRASLTLTQTLTLTITLTLTLTLTQTLTPNRKPQPGEPNPDPDPNSQLCYYAKVNQNHNPTPIA